jgi:hypothetical protein
MRGTLLAAVLAIAICAYGLATASSVGAFLPENQLIHVASDNPPGGNGPVGGG